MKSERIECLSEILDELEISLTKEQIEKIVENFSLHLEMEREYSSYTPSFSERECDNCKKLKSQLSDAEKEIAVYNSSVRQRRNASAVWVQDGEVRYDR